MAWALSRSHWRRKTRRSKPDIFIVLSLSLILIDRLQSATFPCGSETVTGERFLLYAPHSGFTNQLWELKNAIVFAAILNRTLIVPPVLDHHAIILGSCPKFRVNGSSDLISAVWDHIMDLIRDQRAHAHPRTQSDYVRNYRLDDPQEPYRDHHLQNHNTCQDPPSLPYISMADIVDLSSLGHTRFRMIDFRIFVSMWCGRNLSGTCLGNSCCAMSSTVESSSISSNYCKSLSFGLYENVKPCVHVVQEDCRTTVWTYQQGNDGTLDSFQPDEQMQKRKKISYVRKRKDLYKSFGPSSDTEMVKILAFGSLFTAPYKGSELYIDIHEAPGDSGIQSLIRDLEFLPFAPEIIAAGKEFVRNKIKGPFLCAQLRLLDGKFKNHWKATFSELKKKLQSEHEGEKNNSLIHIFIMTDLPRNNWAGTYLESLANNTKFYKVHTLHENDELVVQSAKRFRVLKNITSTHNDKLCSYVSSHDILLYIEETVCSCASMGFVGTSGSTITESILSMRKNDLKPILLDCSLPAPVLLANDPTGPFPLVPIFCSSSNPFKLLSLILDNDRTGPIPSERFSDRSDAHD
ncbi:hypothetical protein KSP40_PGU006586 [Platanthera guangdongensis]|uniref:O-fucosyltransferase family protein n=1 Tax=Platanthera guangdongensis TaxID=2320717 RepID=A0ABR2MX88_9ASPA